MNSSIEENQYSLIKKNILRLIAKGYQSFKKILRNCDGLYPSDLKQILDHLLIEEKILDFKNGKYYLKQKKGVIKYQRKNNYTFIELPKPHLHDYDWRFSTSSKKYISEKILENVFETDNILLLGAPSILVDLLQYDPIPNLILIDYNQSVIDYLKTKITSKKVSIYRLNLLTENWSTNSPVEKVFLDPPWYLEYYATFLIQASLVTQIGSSIDFVLHPLNTRQDAFDERWKILNIANKLGFSLKAFEYSVIQYETPDFEKSSLKVNGIKDIHNWRFTDLVSMIKYRNPDNNCIERIRKSLPNQSKDEEWFELIYKKYKIKLRGPFNDLNVQPKLVSIEKNDILPSVSREYYNRKNIDLWLSDNRVFQIEGHAAFIYALLKLAEMKIPNNLRCMNPSNIAVASSHLKEIL